MNKISNEIKLLILEQLDDSDKVKNLAELNEEWKKSVEYWEENRKCYRCEKSKSDPKDRVYFNKYKKKFYCLECARGEETNKEGIFVCQYCDTHYLLKEFNISSRCCRCDGSLCINCRWLNFKTGAYRSICLFCVRSEVEQNIGKEFYNIEKPVNWPNLKWSY